MGHDTQIKLLGRSRKALAAGAVLAVLAGGAAHAQSVTTNSAQFNGGYGRAPGTENMPIDVDTRDARGNRLIVDGLIQDAGDGDTWTRADGKGAAYGAGATAIGNNLVVVTQGSWNTVIVNSTQINNGNVTATGQGAVINGELDLDD
jgi:holdfast attachment protein HfaA